MKKLISCLAVFFILMNVVFITSCSSDKKERKTESTKKQVQDPVADMREAYIFGFPLVLSHLSEKVMTNPISGSKRQPLNRFTNVSNYNDSEFKDILYPNPGMLYSSAWVALGKEPVVLSIPDTKDRYYVLNVMDAWRNIIFTAGKNTTGTAEQNYIFTSPDWEEKIEADGMQVINSPTNMIYICAYFDAKNIQDAVKNVVPIQKKLKIIPLADYGDKDFEYPQKAADEKIDMAPPLEQIFKMDLKDYFNLLNVLMLDNKPYPQDQAFFLKTAYLGFGSEDKEFSIDSFDEETQNKMNMIPNEVKTYFQELMAEKTVNGWLYSDNTKSYESDYERRAFSAYRNIANFIPEDFVSAESRVDDEKEFLSGNKEYVLHFNKEQIPPAKAMWILAAYNTDLTFAENTLKRYWLSSKDDLQYNSDGSLDIYIQNKTPGKDKESNWLPIPDKEFILVFNVYGLGKDKRSELPAVKAITNYE